MGGTELWKFWRSTGIKTDLWLSADKEVLRLTAKNQSYNGQTSRQEGKNKRGHFKQKSLYSGFVLKQDHQSARLKNVGSVGFAQIRENTVSGFSRYSGTGLPFVSAGLVNSSLVVNQNSGDGFAETTG